MGSTTEIAWTDSTWNPMTGCTPASPGCNACYAKATHDKRHKAKLAGKKLPPQYLRPFSEVQCFPERLDVPLRWKKPRHVFVCSTGDLFHKDVPFDFIDRVWAVMLLSPRHTYQVLTKRPERMLEYLRGADLYDRVLRVAGCIRDESRGKERGDLSRVGISNPARIPARWIWLGVTVEDQQRAVERIPRLLQVPAAVRFLSCEPLLESVWIHETFFHADRCHAECAYPSACRGVGGGGIDWVICGGESGPRARPFDLSWARSLRDQCAEAGVPFFMKQMGRRPRETILPTPLSCECSQIRFQDLDGRGPEEWPEDLRVREMPEVRNG